MYIIEKCSHHIPIYIFANLQSKSHSLTHKAKMPSSSLFSGLEIWEVVLLDRKPTDNKLTKFKRVGGGPQKFISFPMGFQHLITTTKLGVGVNADLNCQRLVSFFDIMHLERGLPNKQEHSYERLKFGPTLRGKENFLL